MKGRTAALYVNGASQPTLRVDGLKGQHLRGVVALWPSAREEAYFSNVRITNVAPQPVTNGGEAAGSWQIKLNTDTGMNDGTLTLKRDEKSLTGTWSGGYGTNLPVSGTWRDGYIELTFTGEWKDSPSGKAAPAVTTLAGWIDGSSAKGRVRVDGRTDGTWTRHAHAVARHS